MMSALSPMQIGLVYLIWTVLLLFSFGLQRVYLVLTGKCRASDFPAGVPHGNPLYWRLNRAHMNAIENFPLLIVLILACYITELSQDESVRSVFTLILIGRFFQSFFHVISYRALWINFRFAAFLLQIFCFLYLAVYFFQNQSILK